MVARTRAAWRDLQGARSGLEEAEEKVAALRDEEEFLRHAVGELNDLSPEAGEDAVLDARRRMMQGAEKSARISHAPMRPLARTGPKH